jgi:CubicO group peptidase (beta-lactamase class C family)
MEGCPPPPDKRVTHANWAETIASIRWTHLNADRVFKTVPIEQDDTPVWVLPRKMLDPAKLDRAQVRWGESLDTSERVSVKEWLLMSETDALVILHHGKIVSEQYFGKMTPQTRHAIWCGSKSFLATILAPYIAHGTLDED